MHSHKSAFMDKACQSLLNLIRHASHSGWAAYAPAWGNALAWSLSISAVLLLWQVAAGFYPAAILPSPGETVDALHWLVGRESFYEHLRLTAGRGAAGFLLAMGLGAVVGLLMGRYRLVAWLLNPLVAISTMAPPVFWVAVLIIWMGLGSGPPVLVVVITATPLVAVNVAQGMQSIPPRLVEMSQIFRVSRATRLRQLYLPALSGHLFAAALIAVRFAWRTVIMAEFIGSTNGLGNRLAWARQNLEMNLAFAYLLVIIGLGMMLEYGILRPAQRRWGWDANTEKTAGERNTAVSTSHRPATST